MVATQQGSLRLFRFAGVTVFLHWSWFLVAVYEISRRGDHYSSVGWNVAEYLALFGIVLLHEFGHSLACGSVGGRAEQIVLWPLGGVAFVSPPARAGAHLWSIAAGPLVNVVLLLVFQVLDATSRSLGWEGSAPDLARLIANVWWINTGLLIFNILPVYPLDGGQILRSLLWFLLGPARSLLVASALGFLGVAGLVSLAFAYTPNNLFWTLLMAGFLLLNCWRGFQHARQLRQLENAPYRTDRTCPTCRKSPPMAAIWACNRCRRPFDPFTTAGTCPNCGNTNELVACPACGRMHPLPAWRECSPDLPTITLDRP